MNTCTEQRTKQFDTVLSFLNSQGLDFIELNEEKYCKFFKGKEWKEGKNSIKDEQLFEQGIKWREVRRNNR